MKTVNFTQEHIGEARAIALQNYNEQRLVSTALPEITETPDLTDFAKNGLGVAAFEDGKMLGFLCCFEPWENAFDSTARGTFTPTFACGVIGENRGKTIKRLYQAAAEKWVARKITYHAIGLYANQNDVLSGLFAYGFGMRCSDGIRPMTEIDEARNGGGASFRELKADEIKLARPLRYGLKTHMGESPCFMYSNDEGLEQKMVELEKRDSRLFIAEKDGKPVAFLEANKWGESFITGTDDMMNIKGAYCLPECRGSGIIQSLMNYMIGVLKSEGYKRLGVDYETFNPTAAGYWGKYFSQYTISVTRRIDECVLMK